MCPEQVLRKATEHEMKNFGLLEKEYPSLGKYENKIYEQFFRHFKSIVDYVIDLHGGDLYYHSLVINGAILRSLNFYRGGLWALGTRNSHVFYDCIRAQCETLALIHYCVSKPEYVKAAAIGKREHEKEELKIPNILTMIDKVDEKYKGIRKDFDGLCEFVHPNPRSLYANVKPIEEMPGKSLTIEIATKCTIIDNEVADHYLNILIQWTEWLFDELSYLVKILAKDFEGAELVGKFR